MKGFWLKSVLGMTALILHCSAYAEDVDLFAGITPPNSGLPNVLLILDNSANWGSNIPVADCYYKDNGVVVKDPDGVSVGPPDGSVKGKDSPSVEQGKKIAIEKCALYNAIDALPTEADGGAKFNVGFMLFNESPAANSGGYPRQAFLPLTTANKAVLKAKIAALSIDLDKGNNAAFAKTLHEAYLYFKGETPYKGTAGTKWDPAAVEGGKYVSHSANSCGRNHIIFIANGGAGEVTNNEARDLLNGLGGNVTQISYPTSEISNSDQGNWADEYARYMRGADVSNKDDAQGIITHGIAVTGASSDGNYPNFIRAMADYGYGSYFAASDVDKLTVAILDTFSQIQAVNSVFASASLPISVSTQGTYLNQVFIGMFRPDVNADPRWAGNLKQYKFVADTSGGKFSLFLGDADSKPAISTANTGFLRPCARSFWTSEDPDSYWSFLPQGTCTTINEVVIPNLDRSNSPDGDIVEKGAAGYRLRSGGLTPTTRKVKTCNGCVLNTDSLPEISDTSSGLSADLVAWIRGADNTVNADNVPTPEKSGQTAADMRPSVHGDVVHSRPVAVDYGGDTGVVVFYGSNDGTFRAINGNQGDTDGNELWSFVAPEHYSKFERLRSNSPELYYPGTPTATATRKDYFFDGPVTAHKDDDNVWVYAAMRRGGSAMYAFDVSAGANLTDPRLKWKADSTTTGLSNIGQTWSAPKVIKAAGYTSVTSSTDAEGVTTTTTNYKPMLIMGGGYDSCEDGTVASDLNTCTPGTPRGSNIYVLDADTGTVLNDALTMVTDRSVVGDITVVTNSSGLAQYAYAADTGGNVYRISIAGAPSTWAVKKIAALGCDTETCPGGVANRKFLFAPEVVVTSGFNAVLLGSGDREHPLSTDAVTASVNNAFYMIKDDRSADPDVISLDDDVLLEIDANSAGLTAAQQTELNAADNKGWYLQYGTGAVHDKEQVVTSAVVVFGVVTFSTHTPTVASSTSCGSNLGTARVYNINFLDASPAKGSDRFQVIDGGGLPPSPVSGIVTVCTSDGVCTDVPFVIGANPESPVEVDYAPEPSGSAVNKSRVYWNIEQ
ncbi:pilus assembly protein [Pseudomonas sp.]|uniref:pilus assembly protein n=1 Tax=Pseudomonas sp. TaxID=306 RepID=UPI002FC91F08